MSDTNRVSLRFVEESVAGTIPATPNWQTMCITGAPTLAAVPATVISNKIRDDRQISDLILVGTEASGEIPAEMAFGVADELNEAAFGSRYQVRNGQRLNNKGATEITAAAAAVDFTVTDEGNTVVVDDILRGEGFGVAGNNAFHIVNGVPSNTSFPTATAVAEVTPPSTATLHVVGRRSAAGDLDLTVAGSTSLDSTILDFTTLNLSAGDWIKLNGFSATPANNGYYRILSIAAASIIFDREPDGIATELPVGAVDVFMGERLINGTELISFSMEEVFNDHSPITFQYLRGMHVDGFEWTADAQSVITNQYTFLGFNAFYSDATTPATETSVDGTGRVTGSVTLPIPEFQVLNSSSNVARISRGGIPITGSNFVLQAVMTIANNLRGRPAVGSLGFVSVGQGEFSVTGSLQTYFDDSSLARDVVNNTETAYDTIFQDDSGHVTLFDLPRIKFSEGAPEVPGKNDDVTINLAYQAILDPTLGYTAKTMRFHGVE